MRILYTNVILAFLATNCDASGVTSRLQIQLPKEFRKADGYEHREALFGLPPYGGSIQQNVYYADSTMCDSNVDYSRGGYPSRPTDSSGAMQPWKSPFILMVDRGDCTFVIKVRNAQKAGAVGVLIADNTCLCDAGDACTPDEDEPSCETKEPIMADDGSGSDITVPSFLLFKQDADPIKAYLKQNKIVRAEMSWILPAPDARVEYELWSTAKEQVSETFKKNFREAAVALGSHAQFTPHYYVYDGIFAGCRGADGENQCYNLCTNNGRYCSTDPDDDLDSGLSGADVVTESLRQICIWRTYGSDGIGLPWWNYVEEFLFRCDTGDAQSFFTNEACIKDAMGRAGVEYSKIQACMDDSGGLEGDNQNKVLEDELFARETAGVLILPSFYVNQAPLRGALTVGETFEAICAGFVAGSEPQVCKQCSKCNNDDIIECLGIGHCPGMGAPNSVSMPFFLATLAGVVICFSVVGLIQWQRSQRQMRAQVRGILAEYMPLDENQKVESVGFHNEDDETEDNGVELS